MAADGEEVAMPTEKYDGSTIIRNSWPRWTRLADGSWSREWRVRFCAPVSDVQLSEFGKIRVDGLDTHCAPTEDSSEIRVATVAAGNAWSDELFFFATERLFLQLEAVFGRILTIEGEARERWRPFR
jgi:hypothetical protein